MNDGARQQSRMQLVEEVYAAFKGVAREGGVSWSQSMLHDHGVRPYTPREYREAGESDRERRWEELVDPSKWKPHPSWGGFNFLDEIGFRYYLAPAMIRELMRPGEEVMLRLCLVGGGAAALFSILDERQRACVVQYAKHMLDESREQGWIDLAADYWRVSETWSTWMSNGGGEGLSDCAPGDGG